MTTTDDLQGFVREALARGRSRAEIEAVLLQAGWAAEHVRGALGGFADIAFDVPVPRPKPYLSAREAFVYLVLFATLYISAFNLGKLIFEFINLGFPDAAARSGAAERARASMRFAIASLVVAFPVFLSLARMNAREVLADPRKRASAVRRWLTYLTLFIAVGVLIGDFTSLLYNFLSGDLTVRFLLKVLTIAVIAGSIFGYYLWDLRREEKEPPS